MPPRLRFYAESLNHGNMGGGCEADAHGLPRLRTSLDSVPERGVSLNDMMGSTFLRQMRAGVDDDLVHPEDRIKNEVARPLCIPELILRRVAHVLSPIPPLP